jgi:hypothetical protein
LSRARPSPGNQIYICALLNYIRFPRMQNLKKLFTKIHARSYIKSWHAYSYHILWLI